MFVVAAVKFLFRNILPGKHLMSGNPNDSNKNNTLQLLRNKFYFWTAAKFRLTIYSNRHTVTSSNELLFVAYFIFQSALLTYGTFPKQWSTALVFYTMSSTVFTSGSPVYCFWYIVQRTFTAFFYSEPHSPWEFKTKLKCDEFYDIFDHKTVQIKLLWKSIRAWHSVYMLYFISRIRELKQNCVSFNKVDLKK